MIKDILPLSSGYKRKYDLYAYWNKKQVVIEFKCKLKDIVDDWTNEKKWFNQLDCIVCWKVDDEDIEAFNTAGLTLEQIEENEFGLNRSNIFPHATHQLLLPYVTPLYIIDLSIIINQ